MLQGFPRGQLFLIAGPCVLEDDALNLAVAEELARLAPLLPGGIIYKASFDKANRSNPTAARGPGLHDGLERLTKVRRESGLPVLTDVHLPDQCAAAASVVDALQIPAFLCRQTDLLEAAGATGWPVNVKKGQWMHPEGMRGAVEKVRGARPEARGSRPTDADRQVGTAGESKGSEAVGASRLAPRASLSDTAVTERGTFFGYGDLVVDMRSFGRMREATGVPVIFDATHSVQRPGQGPEGASGGAREFIPTLALAAVAAGADGLFLETHPDPDHAPSDGPNMLPLASLGELVRRVRAVWEATRA
jgi:2-dehydro-3-deoxyphosphooctonate aldolase (KDO 8-P synthase)